MGKVRSTSSPPKSSHLEATVQAAVLVAQAAASAATSAQEAAASVEAAASASHRAANRERNTDATSWPPPPNLQGQILFFARDYPGLDDGIYTTFALENRRESLNNPKNH